MNAKRSVLCQVRSDREGCLLSAFHERQPTVPSKKEIGLFDAQCDQGNLTIVMKKLTRTVSKSGFKSRALEYFRQIERDRKPLIITDRGKPVLKVVPFSDDPEDLLMELRGSVLKYEDPTKPVAESDWDAFR